MLERLIPKLKIRDVAKVVGNNLEVQGKLAYYRIHLGSANIIMEPGGYLCIVQDRKKLERVFLPFEGDQLLSVILSKALMLADDDKITDKSIKRQIRR